MHSNIEVILQVFKLLQLSVIIPIVLRAQNEGDFQKKNTL